MLAHRSGWPLFRMAKNWSGKPNHQCIPSMKNQRTKYIKVRMTPEEVQQFKEKSASYSSVSHYIRSALAEYSNIGTKRQLELMNDLGLFYRKYQNELPGLEETLISRLNVPMNLR